MVCLENVVQRFCCAYTVLKLLCVRSPFDVSKGSNEGVRQVNEEGHIAYGSTSARADKQIRQDVAQLHAANQVPRQVSETGMNGGKS